MPVNDPLDLDHLRSVLDQAGNPWHMTTTSMTALTEEQRVVRLGVPVDSGDRSAIESAKQSNIAAAVSATADSVGAPAAFDLRNIGGVNYTTPVKNQGSCGSCVAFGTVGMMEHVTRFSYGAPYLPVDLSEAQAFYYYGRQAGRTCSTGWFPEPLADQARDNGITIEEYFPYTAGDQDASKLNADWPNRLVKIRSWQSVTNNPAAMKENIARYGSITACFLVYQDFFSYSSGVYRHRTGDLAGGHCVTLVGYDDAQQCWIGKNSWGPGWGEQGFFRIGYGECGIETWHNLAALGTLIHNWLPDQRILALWSNETDANVWAYGELRGWLNLNGSVGATDAAMLAELAASKANGAKVGLYEDNGSVQQIYAW
ncbi:C1 family peptidase [Streptomyces sp. NPDC001604]|uniref:C1 family peptidase n=1 Tax=Streptomyces sp. NPDC001604 TaxID=3364593 RepID=UPI00368AD75E